jgi:hypothetical protein
VWRVRAASGGLAPGVRRIMSQSVGPKLLAAGKIALGAARIVGGVVTATGHGILGSDLRSHHQMHVAARVAKSSIEGGGKMCKEGWDELNR